MSKWDLPVEFFPGYPTDHVFPFGKKKKNPKSETTEEAVGQETWISHCLTKCYDLVLITVKLLIWKCLQCSHVSLRNGSSLGTPSGYTPRFLSALGFIKCTVRLKAHDVYKTLTTKMTFLAVAPSFEAQDHFPIHRP